MRLSHNFIESLRAHAEGQGFCIPPYFEELLLFENQGFPPFLEPLFYEQIISSLLEENKSS
jgi:hypothetical protein